MDVLDQPLESGSPEVAKESGLTETEDQDGTLSMDQYQFRADGPSGQPVTYRVVQVAGGSGDEQGLLTAPLPPGTQVAQAVLQSPFSGNGGSTSPTGDGAFTYIPTSSVINNASGDSITTTELTSAGGGQFYVMMSPQDVLQSQRSLAPAGRSGFSAVTATSVKEGRGNRDDRRRATHNEVERRRRDKINNWILALSKLVPDCAQEVAKQGQAASKGGILSKACEYIQDLRGANLRLGESLKEAESLSQHNEQMRQQLEQSREEISMLRRLLEQHGIEPGVPTPPPNQ